MIPSQHRALVRQVTDAIDVALAVGADEADVPAGLARLEPIYSDLFGPRHLEVLAMAEGLLLAIYRRATFGTLRPATSVRMEFGLGAPGDSEPLDANQVPLLERTYGQMLSASLVNDWSTYIALFEAYHAGEVPRARELIDFSFRMAADAAAKVPCTCGNHPHRGG